MALRDNSARVWLFLACIPIIASQGHFVPAWVQPHTSGAFVCYVEEFIESSAALQRSSSWSKSRHWYELARGDHGECSDDAWRCRRQ